MGEVSKAAAVVIYTRNNARVVSRKVSTGENSRPPLRWLVLEYSRLGRGSDGGVGVDYSVGAGMLQVR